MATRVSLIKKWGDNIYQIVAVCIRWITEPSASIEQKQRRRIRLLSVFLLIMTLNTLIASIILKNIGGNTWVVMAVTSAVLLFGYFLNRTRYYRVALVLALIIPAVPPSIIAIAKPPEINLTAELMWLSLPLLIASLMLNVRQIIILTLSYIALIILLNSFGFLGIETLAPLLGFILVVTFIVTAVAAVRRMDQSEIENQLIELQKVENTLKESEEKFSKAFHAIPVAITITRLNDGLILDVNDRFLRTRGLKREEAIGHTGEELHLWLNPGEREKMIQLIKDRGNILHEERQLTERNGKLRTILLSANIIEIGGESYLITFTNDISERKQMENALRESEEKFSKAFKVFPDAVAIVTLKNGIYVDVNDRFLEFNGYTREEVIGHASKELNIWVNRDSRYRIKQLVEKQGRFEEEEFLFRRKTGEIRTVLLSAEIIHYGGEPHLLTIGNDITERKKMETALKESEEKFFKAFQSIPEAITISRLKDGVLIDVNESLCRSRGLKREEAIGHTGEELHLWLNPGEREKMIQKIKDQGSIINEEQSIRGLSGETRAFLFSADIINIGGEPCMISVSNDISERKRMEEKLKKTLVELELSSAQLKATNKELESFSYSVSHDLRSPLRSIDGFSQALLEDYAPKLDGTAKDYLNRLRNASQKMGELIDGLLKLSRLTRSEMHYETVDLSAIAQEIAARFQETNKHRQVEFIIDDGLTANGDSQMLRVLLENLFSNAWKFTQKTPQARIEFGSTVNGEKKTFFIRDNGAGFDMAFKDKLFGAFQRLHDTADFPGTGIGLATVQRIINRHGGSIRAEGAVSKGAAFYFTLS